MSIIKGASYFTYDGTEGNRILDSDYPDSKEITFYSYEGETLSSFNKAEVSNPESALDTSAKKPQVHSCSIRYWKASQSFIPGRTNGIPGWFISFYDKNRNKIKSYRYDLKTQLISWGYQPIKNLLFNKEIPSDNIHSDFPLDLSQLKNIIQEDV